MYSLMPAKENDLRSLLTDGLQHEDRFVRQYCLSYWKDQPERGEAQARRVITALEAYGMQAFPYPHEAYKIPLDGDSFDRLVDTLEDAPCFDDKDLEYFGRWFQWCLSVKHETLPKVVDFLKSDRVLGFEGNGFVSASELLEQIEASQGHDALDADACCAAIETAMGSIQDADEFPHEIVGTIESLLDRLLRVASREKLADYARALLARNPMIVQDAEDAEKGDWTDDFRFGFGVYLAGELGLAEAIDRIIDGISQADWDWLNELSDRAMRKMHPSEATARLRARWWNLPEYGRLFLSNTFTVAHLPEHRDFYLENMARLEEHDFEIVPHRMARALALQGDADSMIEATKYWEENAHDPEAFEVAETLYAIHRARSNEAIILEVIRQQMLDQEARQAAANERMARLSEQWARKQRLGEISLPVVRTSPKVGRNDPCPCGSGRKYKRCCYATEHAV